MSRDRRAKFLEGNLPLAVGIFGAPLALGMALQTTFNLVDAWLVAQLPPAEVNAAVGAIGICDLLAAVGTIVSYGVSTASASILSRRQGARDEEGVVRAAWQSLIVVGILSVVFGLVGVFGSGFLVRGVVGAKGEVARVATRYLRVIVGGSFSIFFLLQLATIQRALGSAKTPAALLVLGNALNVPLAAMLVFGEGPAPPMLAWATTLAKIVHAPRLGMEGAAWATVIARTVVLLPSVLVVAKRFRVLPKKGARAPIPAELRELVRVAWPSSAQFVVRIGSMLLVAALVARFFTTEEDQTATTAMGLVFRVDTMALFIAMGWGSAAQTFVGVCLGAGKRTRAVRAGWITAAFDAVTGLVLVLALARWGTDVLAVFDKEPEPLRIASSYLAKVAPAYLPLGGAIVLGHAIAGAGATRTTLRLDLLGVAGVQAPLCLLVTWGLRLSLETLFYALAASYVVSFVIYAVAYTRSSWSNVDPDKVPSIPDPSSPEVSSA